MVRTQTRQMALQPGDLPPGAREESVSVVASALSSRPLFSGVHGRYLTEIAERAEAEGLDASRELILTDGGPMFVVCRGALHAQVGQGPGAELGPGSVLNAIGMLGLGSSGKQAMARGAKSQGAAEPPPMHRLAEGGREGRCLGNLCSHAGVWSSHDMEAQRAKGWLRMTVVHPQHPRARPAPQEGQPEESREGGAAEDVVLLAAVTMKLVQSVLGGGPCWQTFLENQGRLLAAWHVVLRHFVLPGLPPEVAWHLAEASELAEVQPGESVVAEGEAGAAAEALVLLDVGEATVEKMTAEGGVATWRELGELGPGAVIGNACFIGSGVPRAATVRARTEVTALTVPSASVLGALALFPGICSRAKRGIRDAAVELQMRLPRISGVLSRLRLFNACEQRFIQAVASTAERQILFCGDRVQTEGRDDSALYLVEFGLLRVGEAGRGDVTHAGVGAVFGEAALLAGSAAAATVSVATPLAFVLRLTRRAFSLLLGANLTEQQRFRSLSAGSPRASQLQEDLAAIDVLKTCSRQLQEELTAAMATRCYLPGQTVTVEGCDDDGGSMFVVTRGTTCLTLLV